MSIFGRNSRPDIPQIDVRDDEATIEPGTDPRAEEESARTPEQGEPRRVKFPKAKWW